MSNTRAKAAKRITLIGAITNAFLGVGKIIGGYFFHSDALIADGVHSLSDLISDMMVLFGAHYASQEADAEHPYGHQRIETASTLFLSILLIVVGLGIAWSAYDEWARQILDIPTSTALIIAIASIIANELLFYYTIRVGREIESDLIKANAWHHRADSASSLVVALGIIGSLCGYPYLDSLAALIVALLIIKMGVEYTISSLKELVDTAVESNLRKQIEHEIAQVAGVNKIHQLRTRSMSSHIFVDVHVLVFPYLSVSEGHYIAQRVHHTLKRSFPNVKDVTVHIDPEDDELNPPSLHLPPRHEVEHTILRPLQKVFPEIQTWTLHYLEGSLTIDLFILSASQTPNALYEHCNALPNQHPFVKNIRFYHIALPSK